MQTHGLTRPGHHTGGQHLNEIMVNGRDLRLVLRVVARIEALTQSLVRKLLDTPTRRLRAESTCPHASEYATVARTLFGLQNKDGVCTLSEEACPISIAAD